MRIIADPNGNVLVQLRDAHVVAERPGEIIIDLNHEGHWIRGFEVIGGMMGFSLKAATKPFLSKQSTGLRVKYDPEADAAYFHLPYGRRFEQLGADAQRSATQYAHSINPTGFYRFDAEDGLVSVIIPTADAVKTVEDFLLFFDHQLVVEGIGSVTDG